MSTTVNVGWLKDNNGEKFAPKTLSSQMVTNEWTLFAEDIQTQIAEIIESSVEITKAEYEALGDSVLTDGKTYFITDVNNDISIDNSGSTVPVIKNATDIIYDNTESDIEASNVQDAIDYLVSNDSNIQTQINDINTNIESCFQSVSNGKTLVASAITDKGIETSSDATFETIANNINSLKLGSGNAITGDVLSGKTFTNNDGVEYTGSMTNNGAISKTITPSTSSQSYTVPKGYHDGTGKVTVNAAPTSLINGDATAANVLSGKTFFSDSYTAKTGTMTDSSGTTKSATGTLDATNKRVQLTVPANAYYSTTSKLYIAYSTLATLIGLTAAKIVKGNTILGIAGTANAAVTSQSGSFTFAVNASKTTEYQIKFPNAFASTSYTLVCTVTAGNYKDYITITTKTKLASGATVYVKNSHTGSQATGTISWIAE